MRKSYRTWRKTLTSHQYFQMIFFTVQTTNLSKVSRKKFAAGKKNTALFTAVAKQIKKACLV